MALLGDVAPLGVEPSEGELGHGGVSLKGMLGLALLSLLPGGRPCCEQLHHHVLLPDALCCHRPKAQAHSLSLSPLELSPSQPFPSKLLTLGILSQRPKAD